MYTRRAFFETVGKPAAAALVTASLNPVRLPELIETLTQVEGSAYDVARDEEFWYMVQQAWTVDRTLVNLNNGGVSPAPLTVQSAMKRHLDYSNEAPVYTMWRILEPQREGVRQRLAREFGCDGEEIALTRNASEGLQICQLGFDLERGDEVLTSTHDYGRMITTFKQRERREGIKLVQFPLPIPAVDDDEVVARFEAGITPRTRAILMCHIVNITGQILPVKKVVHMARAHGIPVIVDGAHSFAHFEFTHEDLDCDYYATSLHKWLFAPHGTGMLYVRNSHISKLWPMMAASEAMDDNIRKFEEIGTHPAANYLAIGEALTFHQGIGAARKEARLMYLTSYWAESLLRHDRVKLQTTLDKGQSCGIAVVDIDGMDPGAIGRYLWGTHRIIVTPIKHADFQGCRITPSVYTTLEELDRFVDAMEHILANGIPDKFKA